MKKFISPLLLILGISLILIPKLNDLYINNNSKKTLNNSYNKIKNSELQNENINNINNLEIDDANILLTIKSLFSEKNNNDIIGILYIPDIDTKLPIFNEPTNENLMTGTSIVNTNQQMGQLNYTLIGHYSKNKSVLFGALMDIEINSPIFISDGSNLYKYKTVETLVVDDTEVSMISIDKYSDPTISLMTCYYSSKTGKRFFVIGKLEEVSDLDKKQYNLIFN